MDEIERPEGISRRRMLKRIGAGAAIAWSAPVLTSLRIPAFAQAASGPCAPTCTTNYCCDSANCGPVPCTSDPNVCLCSSTIAGDCFCAQNVYCSGSQVVCATDADCAFCGGRCMNDCSGTPSCLPPCGSNTGGATGPLPAQA